MKFLLFYLLVSMPLTRTDTTINGSGYFIAMEYKGLPNCIYKVYVNDSLVLGAKVNGYITVEGSFGIGKSIPKSVMHNPEAYVDKTMDDKYVTILSDKEAFLHVDKDNFIIRRTDIKKIYNNPNKKGGMGYYPPIRQDRDRSIENPGKPKIGPGFNIGRRLKSRFSAGFV